MNPELGFSEVLRDVAQLGSALRSGRRGRRFKSCHPDQNKKVAQRAAFFVLVDVRA